MRSSSSEELLIWTDETRKTEALRVKRRSPSAAPQRAKQCNSCSNFLRLSVLVYFPVFEGTFPSFLLSYAFVKLLCLPFPDIFPNS